MYATIPTPVGDITGISIGGVYTSMVARKYRLGFDIGIPIVEHVGIKTLCLSHVHSDHVGALLGFIGARDLVNQTSDPLKILVPESEVEMVQDLIKVGSRLSRYPLRAVVVPVVPGSGVNIGQDLAVEVFKTHHVVPSVGYSVVEMVQKLRPEFIGQDIAKLKKTMPANELFVVDYARRLTYITDTSAKIFETNPEILKSDVLICEATYLCDRYPRAEILTHGHMHIDDVVDAAKSFTGKQLVLMHFSKKYHRQDILTAIQEKFHGGTNVTAFIHPGWE